MRNVNDAPLSPFTQFPGWETVAEQELLIKYARKTRPMTNIVEIGSENGMSASIWATYAPEAYIFCIEPDVDAPFYENLKERGLASKVYWISQFSQNVVWAEVTDLIGSPDDIDLLFIDGDHSYNGAKTDLMRYTRHIRNNCYVILHDVAWETNKQPHPLHLEVRRAVDDWASTKLGQGFHFVEAVDSAVVFQRRVS